MKPPPLRARTLPQLLMRRALLVVAAVLLATAGMGLLGMQDDVVDEVEAATHLSQLMAVLGRGPTLTDDALLKELHGLDRQHRLRHLAVELRRADNSLLLTTGSEQLPEALEPVLGWLGARSGGHAQWSMGRPAGPPWQVRLISTPGGEQREAVATLAAMLGLMLAGSAGLLLSMRWNLGRALQPLDQLLAAIGDLGRHDHSALRQLPPMPVTELASIASALRLLDDALQSAQAHSRQLSHKMMRLQEEERARVAHELHDEFGQRLTAMRVDAARLLRGLPDTSPERTGIARLQSHCEQLQRDVRSLLSGLQPFGPAFDRAEPVPLTRLQRRLTDLAQAWHHEGGSSALNVTLTWTQRRSMDPPGPEARQPRPEEAPALEAPKALVDSPENPDQDGATLPRELALTLYRITQEALTNVARHANANQVEVTVDLWSDSLGTVQHIDWRVSDDGVGVPNPHKAMRLGNGLAGITQRVFAAGGDLLIETARGNHRHRGLCLSAKLLVSPFEGPPRITPGPPVRA